jgi:hypothetical protein
MSRLDLDPAGSVIKWPPGSVIRIYISANLDPKDIFADPDPLDIYTDPEERCL